MADISVGVSGWRYASWRGDFYPPGLVQRRELEYVASRMTSVEMNGSFYSLQRPSTYLRMVEQTPDDFPIAVKGGRYITHLKRLVDVDTPLANFFASGVLALGHQLGPVLWQLPPNLPFDEERVGNFLGRLPRTTGEAADLAAGHDDKVPEDRSLVEAEVEGRVRHVLEVRHPSFSTDEAVSLLEHHDIGLVVADSPGLWPHLERATSDVMYVRLHGHTELYASGYAPRSLDRWADKVRGWHTEGLDVFVYFDNDARGRAPHDAVGLLDRLAH
ncbi:DUF72 domain-containing protein [Nocardioides sp.]|uniref:DUF72 domain-containing protein n=1 Tax=Nocardioides sp. TaxID=35761 RepID=UPI00273500EE|nr:DUF72 domain-containing protein [Nocardioides sp.]MDP3893831.1 DUF72 domain-containing protein [Nocardioides sp.]